jgi:plasmid stabilization system protein ParE
VKTFAFTSEAMRDRDRSLLWYLEHASVRVAIAFEEELEALAQQLANYPGSGTPRADGTRQRVFRNGKYLLIYQETDAGIFVLRVFPTASNPAGQLAPWPTP